MKIRELAIFNRLRHKYLLEGLHLLHDTLAASRLHNRYWICGGAVLGWAREGALLAHDPDVDFHFWQDDHVRFMQAAELLAQVGFKRKYCWRNIAGEITEYTMTYKSLAFDFFAAHKNRGGQNTRWYLYVGSPSRNIPPMELLQETPGCELEPFEFYGKRWLKPKNHEAYLAALYGDWRSPNPNFDYLSDCPGIVRRTLLPGKHTWSGA